MREKSAEMDYTASDELKPGRTDFESTVPVSVDLLNVAEGMNRLEAVADHTSERIKELVHEQGYRYRDIVILMPEVSTDGPKMGSTRKRRSAC